jgi:hypothetical protein
MDNFNPGVEMLYVIPGSENKNRLHIHNSVLVINSHYTMDAQITPEFQPCVEMIT